MKLLIVCTASTEIGLGHLVRVRTFIEKIEQAGYDIQLHLVVVGDSSLKKLVRNLRCPTTFSRTGADLVSFNDSFDAVVFDSLTLPDEAVLHLKHLSKLTVSLSPIFSGMRLMDMMVSRTKYSAIKGNDEPPTIYGGLQYTLVQPDCYRIDPSKYLESLSRSTLQIAVAMGGGDASNKSLQIVKALRNLPVPSTIWVMLGEGYRHSYDDLIDAVEGDSQHEIILAKTNRSLWTILHNCSLLVTTSGITSYEAAYAGLPSLTFYDSDEYYYLIRELIENEVAVSAGRYNGDNVAALPQLIQQLYVNKSRLVNMNKNSHHLIDGKAAFRIVDLIQNSLHEKVITASLSSQTD